MIMRNLHKFVFASILLAVPTFAGSALATAAGLILISDVIDSSVKNSNVVVQALANNGTIQGVNGATTIQIIDLTKSLNSTDLNVANGLFNNSDVLSDNQFNLQ